ncbi:MAG: hypothetical protein HYY30_04150 [Chloroflexi bacterium]|nr:hypothetical protein [Chloroflexota bacterium]
MSRTELLKRLSTLSNGAARRFGIDDNTRKEERVKSVYGNLGMERPDLDIERVRRVLDEDRSKRS